MSERNLSNNDIAASFGLRLTNYLLEQVDRFRSKPAFAISPDEVIRAASKISGVTEHGCLESSESLELLCASSSDPRRTPVARILRKGEIVSRAVNRLLIDKQLREDPEIVDEPLEKPWFIMGLPRSGTTLLHRLLAQDPMHRAPLCWETLYPLPRGPRDTTQRRVNEVRRILQVMHALGPRGRLRHEMRADLPEECNSLLCNSLVGGFWVAGSEEFNTSFEALDKTRAYELHKLQLQYLQRNSRRRTWILKAPSHLLDLDSLLKVYPDARIIQVHRNPTEVLPSMASLNAYMEVNLLRKVDVRDCGRRSYEHAKNTFYPAFQISDTLPTRAPKAALIDVRYTELMENPLAVVANIYKAFICPLSDTAERNMSDFLRKNPRNKHGSHKYSLEEFGLDAEQIRHECRFYTTKYLDSSEFTAAQVFT